MTEGDAKAVADFVAAVSDYPGVVAQVYAVAPMEWKRLVELARKIPGGNLFPPGAGSTTNNKSPAPENKEP